MSTDRLMHLYQQTSKHSNYQILPSRLQTLIPGDPLEIRSRWERERLTFMTQHHDFRNEVVLDIGGNTGFFTFEVLEHGAKKVLYFEGNIHHAEFVNEAARQLGLDDRIDVANEYFQFNSNGNQLDEPIDTMLLLNVLHHTGDDYGDITMSKSRALEDIANSLKQVASMARTLIFQLGFNWKGNPELPLFPQGTKREMIDFVQEATRGVWHIDKIGIATGTREKAVYEEVSGANIARVDALGEFLNRPLFLMTRIAE